MKSLDELYSGIGWRLALVKGKIQPLYDTIKFGFKIIRYIVKGRLTCGMCPICGKKTLFLDVGPQRRRESYRCIFCNSTARNRAFIIILETLFPEYRELRIHESSPGSASSKKLARECKYYNSSHYFPDVAPGSYKDGIRCENIEQMTFQDESFDLLVTQDVFEHVLHPDKAFAEIGRVLKSGGTHVFTVPFRHDKKTKVRVSPSKDGLKYLDVKRYHGNPIDNKGSLVITDWGDDLIDYIYLHSGMITSTYMLRDPKIGLNDFFDVFVSKKLPAQR